MKRMRWLIVLLLVGFAVPVRAQLGMDLFKRPSFTKVFHPVVGQGAQYATTSKSGTRTMAIGIVGKESVDGKDGYWMQFVMDEKGQTLVGKSLITAGDFQTHRAILQMPGRPAMEMPMNPNAQARAKMEESLQEWHSVGTETVTVPAGTFSCEHWKNDKNGSEVWTSDKVTPFGLVKEAGSDSTMVLAKVLTDFPDRITGPVQKFDPQQMMQQMQQQRQQPQQ
jgi:hypothetical protein